MSDTATEPTEEEGEGRPISLRIANVVKVFEDPEGGEVRAVDDISIDVADGEFLVIVGPSGCGKTTLLRTIAGLEQPTAGRIEINGRDVAGLEPRERDVSMVFQNYALYPHKTVEENIAFPLRVRKYPAEEVDRRVEETARLLDIPELLDRRPGELSGGQQQRVALGRAIVRDPELFLFDEPLSNLDAKLRIQMRTELNKLHDRVGKTSVYVTHDQAEAMTLGDRVAVLRDGTLQQIAPPQELFDRPVNEFVAGFIGEPPMNFFDVRFEARDGGGVVVGDGFELSLPDGMADALAARDGVADDLVFGVRPEHLRDASLAGDVPPGTTIDATVEVVEPMGTYKLLTMIPVGSAGGEEAEFTASVDTDSTAAVGDEITLAVDLDETHVFAGETGENLTL